LFWLLFYGVDVVLSKYISVRLVINWFFSILSFNIELVGRRASKYFLNCFLLGYIGLMNMITSFDRITKIDLGLFLLLFLHWIFISILDLLGIVLYNFLNLLYIWLFCSNNPSRGFEEFIHVDSSFFNWILFFFQCILQLWIGWKLNL
jgi:hypothetical protein